MSQGQAKSDRYDIMLLGLHTDPGITLHLRTYGFTYASKYLNSSQKNWATINSMLAKHLPEKKLVVIMKITEYSLVLSLLPGYEVEFRKLCELIPQFKQVGYLYDSALAGDFTCFKENAWDEDKGEWGVGKEKWNGEEDGWGVIQEGELLSRIPPEQVEYFRQKKLENKRGIDKWHRVLRLPYEKEAISDLLKARIEMLQRAGVNLVPYRKLKDIRMSLTQFLTESTRGLILRIYLANERFLAAEFEKLLKLFVDYLCKVESFQISVDQVRTARGQVIEFYSKDGQIRQNDLTGLLEKFSHFLQVCSIDIDQALSLIGPTNISKEKLNELITRYAKEARRLLLDVQQEKERKFLSLRHRLQAEAVDFESEAKVAGIGDVQDSQFAKAGDLDLFEMAGLTPGSLTVFQNPTITLNHPQFIAKANGIIAQELNGDIQYSDDDLQVLEYFKSKSTTMEYIELKSCLDQLKDEGSPEAQKTTAWQKIRGFLSKHSDKLGDLGIKVTERIIDKYIFSQP